MTIHMDDYIRHTAENWIVLPVDGCLLILGAEGSIQEPRQNDDPRDRRVVCEIKLLGDDPTEDQHNAHRIISCVNACGRVDIEPDSPEAVRDLVIACKSLLASLDHRQTEETDLKQFARSTLAKFNVSFGPTREETIRMLKED